MLRANREINMIQTQKRLDRTLFITTKHQMRIFMVIPFFRLQNNTEKKQKQKQLSGEKGDVGYLLSALIIFYIDKN